MFIDFHTHVFPDKIAKSTIDKLQSVSGNHAYTDGTVKGLVGQMVKSKINLSVTLPVLTKPTQFDSVLNFANQINQEYNNGEYKLISFAGIHPLCDNIKDKMALVKQMGFKGVKIHPDYQGTFIDNEGYIEILKCAKDLDLVVVTHSGIDGAFPNEPVKCPPELCAKVIDKVNHDKFVLAHYGAHRQWEQVLDMLCGKNVYFDTAETLHDIDKDLFTNILEKHGEDKVLFASDCPWCSMEQYVKLLADFVNDKGVFEKISHKNALKLLNLEWVYENFVKSR